MRRTKTTEFLGRSILLGFTLWFSTTYLCRVALAAVDFPKKGITVIVGFSPGGGRDIVVRGVGKTISKYLGVPIVVLNVPGAGGARGNMQLFNSAPDGYTLGIGAQADLFDQIIQKRDYDNKGFTFIGVVQHTSPILFVKSDSPFRSVKEFKSYGKPVRCSTSNVLNPASVATVIFANREKFPLALIGGYQADVAGMLAVIRGEVEFTNALMSSAMPYLKAGQLRPILVVDQKRNPTIPEIPTIAEAGHPDLGIFTLDYWFMAPPGLPKTRTQILEDAVRKTLQDPEFLEWAKGSNVDATFLSGEETTKLVHRCFEVFDEYKGEIEKLLKKGK